jgi:RNA polymerase sigma-70 factor (ECF subfamily)
MSDTSDSLLERLRKQPDESTWKRLVDLYTPLIRRWLRRCEVRPEDVDDLTQEVLGVVVHEMPRFEHNQRPGAFRCWLRTITLHRLRGFWRSSRSHATASGDSEVERQLNQLEDPNSGLSRFWDEEHDRHVLGRLMDLIASEFSPHIWQAFELVALKGEAAADVATKLDTTVNAVLLAKSRVLRRLRQEARGLVD